MIMRQTRTPVESWTEIQVPAWLWNVSSGYSETMSSSFKFVMILSIWRVCVFLLLTFFFPSPYPKHTEKLVLYWFCSRRIYTLEKRNKNPSSAAWCWIYLPVIFISCSVLGSHLLSYPVISLLAEREGSWSFRLFWFFSNFKVRVSLSEIGSS